MSDIPVLPTTFDSDPFAAPLQNGQRVQFQDRVIGRFYMHPVQLGARSRAEGRPIFENRIFIEIRHPGERDVLVREATDEDKMRFNRQWNAFQTGTAAESSGTSLSLLFPANPAVIATLQLMNVWTIEQLAGLNGTQLQNVGMGGVRWQQLANDYLETAKKGADFTRIQGELEKRDVEILRLKELVEKLETNAATAEQSQALTPKASKRA